MYSRGGMQNGLQQFTGGRIPFTWTMIAINIATFFLIVGVPSLAIIPMAAFRPEQWWLRPWSLFTWSLLGAETPLSLIFSIGWMYLFGGSMERAWGTSVFARFFAATTALSALTYALGAYLIGSAPLGLLLGLFPAMGATVVAWALVNQRETISFFFLPLPAWAVGLLGIAITWYYAGGAIMGLFALSGCAAAYWYVVKGRSLRLGSKAKAAASGNTRFVDFDREVKGEVKPSNNPFTRAAEEKKRRERDKKLEEMFRRSGYDDDGNRS
ncbi:MAG: rhomboid family intramembrane serine protease [Armatimonas sp.]